MKEISIYIHIPFCRQKCDYCNFFSVEKSAQIEEVYFKNLSNEISSYESLLKDRLIKTIYFGGGTPSIVDGVYINNILSQLRTIGNIDSAAEITIECNPEDVVESKLENFKSVGINRISIGLQTTNTNAAELIGRRFDKKQWNKNKHIIKKHFDNISIDIMLGLPSQSMKEVKQTIKEAISAGVGHISCYDLTLKEKTPLFERYITDLSLKFEFPTQKQVVNQREAFGKVMETYGMFRYEVSNYAKPGLESRHNLNYWLCGDFLGLGAGAYSKVDDMEWENETTLPHYNSKEKSKLTKEEKRINKTMMGLRTSSGIDISLVEKNEAEILIKSGHLALKDGKIKATTKGFNVLDEIILRLV
ncbi:MAG: radical SAM family heme chaperone HemW [Firmicutes bacterium]|nr:radical SAM family heme chaperone HemW [Bacillota bacterium]